MGLEEPLLRVDLLEVVRAFCRDRFEKAEFVVCTNLQHVSDEAWTFLSAPDTFMSTSLDGDRATHTRQRTFDAARTDAFLHNLARAIEAFGPEKVSALPTIDPGNAPAPEKIIRTFAEFGIRSIYLRPVNYQGFARKRYGHGDDVAWNLYYDRFIDAMIAYKQTAPQHVEEYYFVHCLRRVLRPGHHGHVDLRNASRQRARWTAQAVLSPPRRSKAWFPHLDRIDVAIAALRHETLRSSYA